VFYIVFYMCLLAFWTLCLLIFLQFLNYRNPHCDDPDRCIIGNNPGLGYRPRPPYNQIESTLIWFKQGKDGNWRHWVRELINVTESYRRVDPNAGAQLTTCGYNKNASENQFCEFKIDTLGGLCTKERNFGYDLGKPCVIIKLNKIYNWYPQVWDTVQELPREMPSVLKKRIEDDFAQQGGNIHKQNVWISCEGESAIDIENIGYVDYYPGPGMPIYYFPYTNVQGYQSPLVAVSFSDVAPGVLIRIKCKAWAKNIKHDRVYRSGSVHFEIMVD